MRRERPRCRGRIEEWVASGRYTLREIAQGHTDDLVTRFSDGLRTQARKMLDEEADLGER